MENEAQTHSYCLRVCPSLTNLFEVKGTDLQRPNILQESIRAKKDHRHCCFSDRISRPHQILCTNGNLNLHRPKTVQGDTCDKKAQNMLLWQKGVQAQLNDFSPLQRQRVCTGPKR